MSGLGKGLQSRNQKIVFFIACQRCLAPGNQIELLNLFPPEKKKVNWEITYVWWWYIAFLKRVSADSPRASYAAGEHAQAADVATED